MDVFLDTGTCEYPETGTFADLLWWHLFVWGTRPRSRRRIWGPKEFASTLFGDDYDPETHGRNMRNWLGGGSPPGSPAIVKRIEDALFGQSIMHERWRAELRLAHGRSRGKGNNVRVIGKSPTVINPAWGEHERSAEVLREIDSLVVTC